MRNSLISKNLRPWLGALFFLFFLPGVLSAHDIGFESEEEVAEAFLDITADVQEVFEHLRSFEPDLALKKVESSDLPDPLPDFFRGWVAHQKAEYEAALEYFNKVNPDDLGGDAYLRNRLEELTKTSEALKDFAVMETKNFVIRYQEGPDSVMMHFLPEIMEDIYTEYSRMFQFVRREKITVELMPSHQLFSYASALSRSQIETTGTIALCVENRLVILSPRRVLQGYYWPDVIAHEFVHYIVTKLGGDAIPLWMHEGIAKYFEARWQDPNAPAMDPGLETSLARAVKSGKFLTVEEMKPSFAALPTSALAAQAYAQTASMIDFLVEKRGADAVQRVVMQLGESGDLDQVLKAEVAMNFDDFEATWREWAKTRGYRDTGKEADLSVELLDSGSNQVGLKELEQQAEVSKKHTRLGDLLLERNRYKAALKQYEKTVQPGEKLDRQILLRMLTCDVALRDFQTADQRLDEHVSDLMNDPTMLMYKVQTQIGLNNTEEAEKYLDRSVYINPFNPDIYSWRLRMLGENPDPKQKAFWETLLQQLSSRPATSGKDSKS